LSAFMEIRPSKLDGEITVMPSKSQSHRALICAALAYGRSVISNICYSADVLATLHALTTLGLCRVVKNPREVIIFGGRLPIALETAKRHGMVMPMPPPVDCNESGSTLRFLIPIAAAYGISATFTGKGRLLQRPMLPYKELFDELGLTFEQTEKSISISGRLHARDFDISGDVSSQFITGLMLILPLLEADCRIIPKGRLESAPYLEITRQVMSDFGVLNYWEEENGKTVLFSPGIQRYRPANITIEGDFSHAAFFLCAGALGGDVVCKGLNPQSVQGDCAIVDILSQMGANISVSKDSIRVSGGELGPRTIDVSQAPDLFPVLSIAACGATGTTVFTGAARLRYKESDRLDAMAQVIANLGGLAEQQEDRLIVNGTGRLRGGRTGSFGDHRVAMAVAIASSICDGDIILEDPYVVSKSAPDFWDEFKQLGGRAYERNLG
jgi:3-phosphoshikimate 1-carboxyvinyltransferase